MQKTFTRATASILVIGLLALLVLVVTYNSNIAVAVGYGSNSPPILSLGVQGISKNAFQLSAKLDTSVNPPFKWINTTNGVINPTLNFKANTNEVIQIQNPTDFKHQFIID
ncbi:MAG: hypothetical protein WAZ77_09840 [Candidatus Nitrosopolaris sp.]|jgi:hypothetical protein